MIKKYNVNDFGAYITGLNEAFDETIMWNELQNKSEFGSNNSEWGYQNLAAIKARMIAEKLNLNADLAELLTKCLGSYFPKYGKQGKELVMEYLKSKGIQISETELAASFVEFNISESSLKVDYQFSDILRNLFDESSANDSNEIQVAKSCHSYMEALKGVDFISRDKFIELDHTLMEKWLFECEKEGKFVNLPEIADVQTVSEKQKPKMNAKQKKEYLEEMKEFSSGLNGEPMESVYWFMSLGSSPSSLKVKE